MDIYVCIYIYTNGGSYIQQKQLFFHVSSCRSQGLWLKFLFQSRLKLGTLNITQILGIFPLRYFLSNKYLFWWCFGKSPKWDMTKACLTWQCEVVSGYFDLGLDFNISTVLSLPSGELTLCYGKIHHFYNGKIHYFYGHFPWLFVSSPGRVVLFNIAWWPITYCDDDAIRCLETGSQFPRLESKGVNFGNRSQEEKLSMMISHDLRVLDIGVKTNNQAMRWRKASPRIA